MLRFNLQNGVREDDELVLMVDETGLDLLLIAIEAARKTGHKHLGEDELGTVRHAHSGTLGHVLIDWCGRQST